MFGALKKLITVTEQRFTGTGTIETGTLSAVISVSGVSWATPIVQVTPIMNGELRNLNVSLFDSNSNSFTVYGNPGDFFWSITS
jgi:ribosome recycling factor